jgi:predicted ArsR family transcriptional regulator
MDQKTLEQQLAGLATLDDPVRRSLYFYVISRAGEVGRDEAARAAGVSRTLAGFHLDRLAREGLLEISFRRLSARRGPGAGRPAKLYRRSSHQLDVSLPQREYGLAARLLATAIDTSSGPETRRALSRTARKTGKRIGADARARVGARPARKRLVESTLAALAAHGYEPEQAAGEIRLRNCPFHALASEHTELVCRMNLALIEGVADGLGLPGTRAVLDPKPGLCCVSVRLGTR